MLELFYNFKSLVGLIIVCILYLVHWYKRPKLFPPGPRGIPILGYIPMIGKRAHEAAAKLSKTYGPIVGVRIGSSDVVVLNDYDSICQVCEFL